MGGPRNKDLISLLTSQLPEGPCTPNWPPAICLSPLEKIQMSSSDRLPLNQQGKIKNLFLSKWKPRFLLMSCGCGVLLTCGRIPLFRGSAVRPARAACRRLSEAHGGGPGLRRKNTRIGPVGFGFSHQRLETPKQLEEIMRTIRIPKTMMSFMAGTLKWLQ